MAAVSPAVLLRRSSEEHLARRARKGDPQALGEIFERYQQELYRFCLGLLGEPQDAQDALQNTMVKALRALPGEEREIALRPWLYRIAHNEAINLRRGERASQALDEYLLDAQSSVAEVAEDRERLEWLLRDLGDLPDRQRAVLVMRELSGLDFADIGAALGTSGAVVRQALYEARRNLEQMEFGRGMRCEAVMRVLSDADGRISSRREIRAHLADCPDCRHFQARIEARKEAFAGIAPLPVGAAAGLLHSILAGAGGSGAGGLTTALGGGAASSIGTAGILKAVATVAAVAVVGTAAVERGSHDHGAARNATAASVRGGRAGHTLAAVSTPRVQRRFLPLTHHPVPTASIPIAASGPPGKVGQRQPRASARPARGQGPVTDAGQSLPIVSVPGKSPSSTQATPKSSGDKSRDEEQSKPAKKMEKQEEKAEKQEEKAVKKAAKGKPAHPVRPEHPAHPEHPSRPVQAEKQTEPTAPQESPEAETTPLPEAEESPGSPSHTPNGKAKGHDKPLSD